MVLGDGRQQRQGARCDPGTACGVVDLLAQVELPLLGGSAPGSGLQTHLLRVSAITGAWGLTPPVRAWPPVALCLAARRECDQSSAGAAVRASRGVRGVLGRSPARQPPRVR